MRILYTTILLVAFVFSGNAQKLIKHEKQKTIKLDNSNKIFQSNAGYCKIYKLTDSLFILHNGYSELKKKTVITRETMDEIVRASELILDADHKDVVELETINMDIQKGKAVGVVFWFHLYNTSTTLDFDDLTLEEARQLLRSSDADSVESDGEKVVDKVKKIESEIKEDFMSLTKSQLKKLIALKY